MNNMGKGNKTMIIFKSLTCLLIFFGATEVFYLSHTLYNKHTSPKVNEKNTTLYNKHTFPKLNEKSFDKTSHVQTRNVSLQKGPGGFSKMILHDVQKCFNIKQCKKTGNFSSCPKKPHLADNFECSHFMKFPKHPGRTGNQLFQVAVLLGTAMNHSYTPLIDPSLPLHEYFDLPNVLDFKLTNMNVTAPRKNTNLSPKYNWTLRGYIHSWKHFKDQEIVIRKALKFKQGLVAKVNDFMKRAVSVQTLKVCVHVRRGDFLSEKGIKRGLQVAPARYIKDAMARFKQTFTRVHFIILSDDKMWCKQNLNLENVTFSPFDSAGLDLALMSLCDHTIMTVGSFGWWGGWLAGGDVIYWAGYPRKGGRSYKRVNRKYYIPFPREWIGLP